MLKKNIFPAKITDLFLIIISSILIGIFYNFKTIESEFLSCFQDSSILKVATFVLEIGAVISVILLFFLVLSFNKILLKTFLIVTIFISTVYLYVLNKFGTILDGAMIANALESAGHADEVIDYSLGIYFLFFALVPALLIVKAEISPSNLRKKIIIGFANVIFIALLQVTFAADKMLKIAFVQYSPANYVASIYEYFDRFHNQLQQGKDRRSLSEFYKFQSGKESKNFNVILIIGESLRADHLGLNGYERNTTPRLAEIPDLLNYTISASFNTTTRSVTSMLSHRTKADFVDIPPEKSVVSVFKDLGFKTYWYSAQSSKEFRNGMLNIMAAEADDYFFRDRLRSSLRSHKIYDEALIPYLQSALKNGGHNFIVLHSFGNHVRFHERHPESFTVFTPECTLLPSSCPKKDVNNSYDNSVLYTDYFVSSVIESLKGTNSILFFASDHGVFLGENGVYANGGGDVENLDPVKKVPMFFYMTDQLMRDKFFHKKFTAATKKTKSTNLSHDNLFDSLLDCSGVKSDLFDRDLSICKN